MWPRSGIGRTRQEARRRWWLPIRVMNRPAGHALTYRASGGGRRYETPCTLLRGRVLDEVGPTRSTLPRMWCRSTPTGTGGAGGSERKEASTTPDTRPTCSFAASMSSMCATPDTRYGIERRRWEGRPRNGPGVLGPPPRATASAQSARGATADDPALCLRGSARHLGPLPCPRQDSRAPSRCCVASGRIARCIGGGAVGERSRATPHSRRPRRNHEFWCRRAPSASGSNGSAEALQRHRLTR